MLLVSAMLMGTATYAWFAMNTSSVADGVEVEAYSDSNYLEISQALDSGYAANTTFTSGNQGTLRLVTHKFFNYNEIVTIVATAASGAYAGTGTYYKTADSDAAGDDLNYVIANGELSAPSSTAGLYKNVLFELVTSNDAVTGTYYEYAQNKYTQKAVTDASAKGLYVAYYYQAAPAAFNGNTTYYELSNEVYSKLDTAAGFTAESDMSSYYVRVNGAPNAESTGSVYDGTSTYYEFDQTSKAYSKVGALELGSSLSGYYTIQETAVNTTTTTGDGSTVYYLKNTTANGAEYSYIGTIANGIPLANYLYWGRAYSNLPNEVQASNTLNIINVASDASNYYLTKTLYLRQANGTNHASNLKIADVEIGGVAHELSAAMRVLFVAKSLASGEYNTALYDAGTDAITYASGTNLFGTLLGDEAETVKVDVYIYFDGTDEVAKNTDAVLNGQTVEIKFAIDELSYN